MNKKFTPPDEANRLKKKSPELRKVIEWYEDKLEKMYGREHRLSQKLTAAHKELKNREVIIIEPGKDYKLMVIRQKTFSEE